MKQKLYLLLSLVILTSFSVLSQEQLKHEQRWHIASDSTFYINWHLPAYLRISTSPEPGAKSHLLYSKSSPQFSNPMYLEKGYNTIRSPWRIDPKTREIILPKQDVVFDVFADADAPVTKANFNKAAKYIRNGVTYYGKGLIISLNSKDALSGVEKVYYSLNGEQFKEYSTEFEVEQEKEYSLKFYAADNVGNAEITNEIKFYLDASAPKVNVSIEGNFVNKIASGSSKVVISTEDGLSGVKQTFYSLNGGKPQLYTQPIPTSTLTDQRPVFLVYSIDNVSNNSAGDKEGENPLEGAIQFEFTNDKEGPVTAIKVIGDYAKGKFEYVSPRSKIEVSAKDEFSAVASIKYGINSSATNLYATPFNLPDKKGSVTVSYMATDAVDQSSAVKSKFYYMDNTAPTSGITYRLPQFFNRDTLFVNKSTKIKLFSGDYEAGISKIEYSVDGAAYQTYTDEFTIANEEGYHTIKFRGTDLVNNVEIEKSSFCLVDNNAPDIFVNFSIQSTGKEVKDGKTFPVYPSYTQLYVAATDRYSGAEKIYYSINGGIQSLYISAKDIADKKLLSKAGFYAVKIKAVDKLGNESEETVEFFIK